MRGLARAELARLAAAALVAVVLPAAGQAPVTLTRQVDEAEAIFIGRVIDEQVRLVPFRVLADAAETLWPFRHYRLTIERVLKGEASGGETSLRFLGGRRPNGQTPIDPIGAPRLEIGKRYLLFVAGNGERWIPLVGWGGGLLELRGDGRDREVLVGHGGIPLMGIGAGNWLYLNVPLHEAPAAGQLLEDLVQFIAARREAASYRPGLPLTE